MKSETNKHFLTFILLFIVFTQSWSKHTKFNKRYSCGRQEIRNPRIVGGDNVFPGEYPWMVSILISEISSASHYCGGILISDEWVLSAAHCLEGYIPDKFIVRLGAHSIQTELETNAIDVPVESMVIHRNYSRPRPYDNDIALLKLKHRVQYNDYIIPICLPEADDPNKGDIRSALLNKYDFMTTDGIQVMGTVVGWGWLRDSDNNPEDNLGDILQRVKLPIISNKECELWYRSRGRSLAVSRTQFCAGFIEGKKDSCRGDSGGPLLVRDGTTNTYYLIGIVSAGIGCALPKLPGLYTRVDSYIDWIHNYVNQ